MPDTPNFTTITPQQAKSVFTDGYIQTSKAVDYTVVTSGYFTIDATAMPDVTANSTSTRTVTLGNKNGFNTTATETKPFWQLIVTTLAEVHEENYSMHNTLADSVSIFSTGAKPIQISISGFVLFAPHDDHLYVLLKSYVDSFRARHLSARDKHLRFVSQDTDFNLIIQSISLGYTVQMETYVPLTVSGLAYDYNMLNSNETLLKTYYGTFGEPNEERVSKKDEEVKRGLKLSGPEEGILMEAPISTTKTATTGSTGTVTAKGTQTGTPVPATNTPFSKRGFRISP